MHSVGCYLITVSGKIGGGIYRIWEIAIKRSMTRDGQSAYFINQTKCRRKDIQDIFLGTGKLK